MAVKIRLQRKGKKGKPYFHIVVADSRAPRDGRYIERLGSYDPNTDPATVEIDVDNAAAWLQKGAQPTDTARAILSYRGVLYRNHLNKGVTKGALNQEDADKKFEAWTNEKNAKIQAKIDRLANESASDRKARLEAEAEVNQKRAAEIAAKNTPEPEEAPESEAPAADVEATETPEAAVEDTATPAEETAEAPVAEEAKEAPAAETPAETPTEEPAEEVKAEEPKAEEAKEEAPIEEKKDEAPAAEQADEEKKD